MERRDFLKGVFSTVLFTPWLAKTGSSGSGEGVLYLINDTPERYISLLINELGSPIGIRRGRYAFLTAHPSSEGLKRTLSGLGWGLSPRPFEADLTLAFQPLGRASAPSFTWINAGRIRDIRTRRLYQLWKEMNDSQATSSTLTIGSFRGKKVSPPPGRSVALYIDGARKAVFSLEKDRLKSIDTRNGRVVMAIEKGAARVLSSTCRHQICLASPPASLAGERIICAPNHFLLEIEGSHFVDTVTG